MSTTSETVKTECCGAVIDADDALTTHSPDGDTFILCGEGVGCEPRSRAYEHAARDRAEREYAARYALDFALEDHYNYLGSR